MRRIRLIRNSPIDAFATTVYMQRERAYRLWLISPWIGGKEDRKSDPVQMMLDALRHNQRCRVTIVTREPRDSWHVAALLALRAGLQPLIYYCNVLHTKLYIVEAQGFRSAVIGSPNLTMAGNRINVELALELRTTTESKDDDIAVAISELTDYARKLLLEDDVILT